MKRGLFLGAVLATVIIGCSKPVTFVGMWDGTLSAKAGGATSSIQSMALEVKEDKTFAMTIQAGMPVKTNGTWTQDGTKLTMQTTHVMDMEVSKFVEMLKSAPMVPADAKAQLDSISKPMVVTMQPDGTATAAGPTGNDTLTFKKKS